MKSVLIATTNPGKLAEIKIALSPLKKQGVTILDLSSFPEIEPPEETGATFEENARLKASYYAEQSQLPTIADDGGIMIDALHGEPGVKSRRWPGYEASDQELIDYTLTKLSSVPLTKRTAKLETCVCFYDPSTRQFEISQEGVNGTIAEQPSQHLIHGYPYRSLFIVDAFGTYYDELTAEQHVSINHRLKAVRKLISLIQTQR